VDVTDSERLLDLLIASARPLPRETAERLLGLSPKVLERQLVQLRALKVPVEENARGLVVNCVDTLDARVIAAALQDMPSVPHVEVWRLCESTNLLAAHGKLPGLYLAELQTSGHGRRGSAWHQAFASGLALSYAVRPILHRFDGLAVALAVTVVGALETLGYAGVRLKWPNDLYFGEAKLGGLMVQAEGGRTPRLVIGLGLNVHEAPALEDRATVALDQVAKPGLIRNTLAAALARALSEGLERFGHEGFAGFADEYRRLDLLAGRAVRLTTPGGLVNGVVRGVGAVGEIAIETPSGLCHYAAGEVSLGVCHSV
jgi:BirA family biotin operon repressor/biotin-[acetyl-CoA-carboxylase] ligase